MGALIGSLAGLLTEIFKFVNTKEATKYLDECVELQKDILEEEAKPYGSQDDDKVVRLRAQLAVITDAAKQELMKWAAAQKS